MSFPMDSIKGELVVRWVFHQLLRHRNRLNDLHNGGKTLIALSICIIDSTLYSRPILQIQLTTIWIKRRCLCMKIVKLPRTPRTPKTATSFLLKPTDSPRLRAWVAGTSSKLWKWNWFWKRSIFEGDLLLLIFLLRHLIQLSTTWNCHYRP